MYRRSLKAENIDDFVSDARWKSSLQAMQASVKMQKSAKSGELLCGVLQPGSPVGYLRCARVSYQESLSHDYMLDHFQTVVQLTARQSH